MAELIDLDALDQQFHVFDARVAPCFYRAEYRQCSARYLRALLSPDPRKNAWQLAESMDEVNPNGAQWLLFGARRDERVVRDELQRLVMVATPPSGNGPAAPRGTDHQRLAS